MTEQSSASPNSAAEDTEPSNAVEKNPRRLTRRTVFSWIFQAGIVAGIFAAASAWRNRSLLKGDGATAAPGFTLQQHGGGVVDLESLKGKRVLLHFWATWCGVCQLEPGALNAVHAGLKKDEVLLSIVADADNTAELNRFIQEHGVKYPVLLGTGAVLRAYKIDAFPTNYFIGKNGHVETTSVGMSSRYGLAFRLGD